MDWPATLRYGIDSAPGGLALVQELLNTVPAGPRDRGWRAIASVALIEVMEAQRVDTWRRLKTCREPLCRAAFYDRSRNNSRVWHDVHTCGNAVNLRAHRARQRVARSHPSVSS